MESGVLTKVINNFFTTVDGELSLSRGDYFLIYNVIDKYWYYGESQGKIGKFPSNHLHKVDIPEVKPNEKLFISIAQFDGEQEGDLFFGQGDFIVGTEEEGDWHFGHIGSRSGIFPLSHVWLLNPSILKISETKKKVKKKAKVKTSLKAQLDDELNLNQGEIVTVLEIFGDGWVLGVNSLGKEGTFPENFIDYIEDDSTVEVDETDETAGLATASTSIAMDSFPQSVISGSNVYKDFGESVPSKPINEEPAPYYYDLFPEASKNESLEVYKDTDPLDVNPYAISLYRFNAQFPNELDFEAGEIVHLIKHIDTEWAKGDIDGKIGIFPKSYVNIIVDCCENDLEENESIESPREPSKDYEKLNVGDLVKVEYTFNAQMNGDLSVAEGDIVKVLEIPNDDWVNVENDNGHVGLCPRGYLSRQSELNSFDVENDFEIIQNVSKEIDGFKEEGVVKLMNPHRPAPPAPAPGSVPLEKQTITEKNETNQESNEINDEIVDECNLEKQKRADKRQNVISELVITEKEYVRDLKLTYSTFHLYDSSILEGYGINVTILFGNLIEVIQVAEELLELILKAMKGIDENNQTIAPCFINMADKLQTVYVKYCSNHEAALLLLKKYEENKEIESIFEEGIKTLRSKIACFDMSSILIKPVQRILKYPLMLNELVKCTENDHPDKSGIEEACKVMTNVATYINEYKRRKDLVSKYLDSDQTLIRKMTRLSMHSFAKKSSRLSAKLSASLGITNIPPDLTFDEIEQNFKYVEKCIWQLHNDIESCLNCVLLEATSGELIADYLKQYHYGVDDNQIKQYHDVRVVISSHFVQTLKETIEKRVIEPLITLITLLDGPAMLINKRHDKLLDYDNAISKSEKYKDSRPIQDELTLAKSNYEALNQQLLEELPILIDAATKIITNCVGVLAKSRKLLYGKITQKYLNLSESSNQIMPDNILQSFLVIHNLLWNQISRFDFIGNHSDAEEEMPSMQTASSSSSSSISQINCSPQTEKIKSMLINKYPRNVLFNVKSQVVSTSSLDIGANVGTIVAVIKRQDPMGDTSRWFVDNGIIKGFIQSNVLEPLAQLPNQTTNNNINDLISLDSPVKENKNDLISLDSPKKEMPINPNFNSNVNSTSNCNSNSNSNSNSSQWYINVNNQIYENVSNLQDKKHDNSVQFYYAECNFQLGLTGTLAVKKGQVLKLIRPYDEDNNTAWWLMENRDGNKGYVPSNYLNIYDMKS